MIFIVMMGLGAGLVVWEIYQFCWVEPQLRKEIKDARDRAAIHRRAGGLPERRRQGPVQ